MSEGSVHRQALPAGTRLQEFELRRYLGSGGFGIVYLGWNTELDIPVAIKEYLPSDCAVRERLPEVELRGVLLPLLEGLREAHRSGVMHWDIKPGNIVMCAEDDSPVLLDFGAAHQTVMAKSQSVTAILTPGYAPLEQYSEKGWQSPWTNVYALGAASAPDGPPAELGGMARGTGGWLRTGEAGGEARGSSGG